MSTFHKRYIYEHNSSYTDFFRIYFLNKNEFNITIKQNGGEQISGEMGDKPYYYRWDFYSTRPYGRYLYDIELVDLTNPETTVDDDSFYFEENLLLFIPAVSGAYTKQQVQDYTNQQPNFLLDPDAPLDDEVFTNPDAPYYLTEGQIEGCNNYNSLDYTTNLDNSGTIRTIKPGKSLCVFGGVAVASDHPIKAVYKYFNVSSIDSLSNWDNAYTCLLYTSPSPRD